MLGKRVKNWMAKSCHKYYFENNKEYHKDRYTDWWIQGYTCGNLFMRQNCQKCLYKSMPRQADISFGDFGG